MDGEPLRLHAQRQRHQRYQKVQTVEADQTETTYWVRSKDGRLNEVPFAVRVFISRRHKRDRKPKFFMSTDLSLSAHEALNGYGHRWGCEVDHFYLKTRLGIGDFLLRDIDAEEKWLVTVHCALLYLQWRRMEAEHPPPSLADLQRQHRQEHLRDWLRGACEMTLQVGAVEPVLERFLGRAGVESADP